MDGSSVGVADAVPAVDVDNPSLRGRSHNEHNTGSVETDKQQRVRQTEPVINSYDSDEAPLSIAKSSGQTLASIAVSASTLPDRDEDGWVAVDISNFMTAKIIDKWPSSSGFEYGASWDRCGHLKT